MRRLFTRLVFAAGLAVSGTGAALAAEQTAIFAGGCFWCVEADFDKVPGVTGTVSGYTGGRTESPTLSHPYERRAP